MNIVVRQDGEYWGAFHGDQRVAKSKCRSCVVNAVVAVTKTSSKYTQLTVMNEDGTIATILSIGAKNARPTQKGI